MRSGESEEEEEVMGEGIRDNNDKTLTKTCMKVNDFLPEV